MIVDREHSNSLAGRRNRGVEIPERLIKTGCQRQPIQQQKVMGAPQLHSRWHLQLPVMAQMAWVPNFPGGGACDFWLDCRPKLKQFGL
jgi:hypothetical protein